MRLVDEGEGFVDDTLGTVEFHQVALTLQDGEVAATGQFPKAHVGITAYACRSAVLSGLSSQRQYVRGYG